MFFSWSLQKPITFVVTALTDILLFALLVLLLSLAALVLLPHIALCALQYGQCSQIWVVVTERA